MQDINVTEASFKNEVDLMQQICSEEKHTIYCRVPHYLGRLIWSMGDKFSKRELFDSSDT